MASAVGNNNEASPAPSLRASPRLKYTGVTKTKPTFTAADFNATFITKSTVDYAASRPDTDVCTRLVALADAFGHHVYGRITQLEPTYARIIAIVDDIPTGDFFVVTRRSGQVRVRAEARVRFGLCGAVAVVFQVTPQL